MDALGLRATRNAQRNGQKRATAHETMLRLVNGRAISQLIDVYMYEKQ